MRASIRFGMTAFFVASCELGVAQSEVCTEIKALVDAASTGLKGLEGPVILRDPNDPEGIDECCYASKNLPGAAFCTLKPSRFWGSTSVYSCNWSFLSSQEASTFAKPFRDAVKACLPADVWSNESEGDRLQFRASLQGGRSIGKVQLYESYSSRRSSIVFSFEVMPMNAPRLRR